VELGSDVEVEEELPLPKLQNKFGTYVHSMANILLLKSNVHMV
jgi:hypothetical protein